MKRRNRWAQLPLVLVAGLCMLFALSASAQVQTQANTTSGTVSKEVQVESGEVVYVNGNDLVVKMEDGTIRHFPNVPESARATVDGKEIGIHDVKVGMKLQKTITTTTTPKLITTVQTVTGKVWQVQPPNWVILTLADGTNQKFNIPKDQKFNVEGQMTDAWGLKKGMTINATKVVEEPITEVNVKQELAGTMPPPPPPDVPLLIAVVKVPPPPAAEEPAELPKTGSSLPLLGLLGALAIVSSLVLRTIRTTK